jgi:hypothetical protein
MVYALRTFLPGITFPSVRSRPLQLHIATHKSFNLHLAKQSLLPWGHWILVPVNTLRPRHQMDPLHVRHVEVFRSITASPAFLQNRLRRLRQFVSVTKLAGQCLAIEASTEKRATQDRTWWVMQCKLSATNLAFKFENDREGAVSKKAFSVFQGLCHHSPDVAFLIDCEVRNDPNKVFHNELGESGVSGEGN